MSGLGDNLVPGSKDRRRTVSTDQIEQQLQRGMKLQTNSDTKVGEGEAEQHSEVKKVKPGNHKQKLFTLTPGQDSAIEDLRKRAAPDLIVNRVDIIRAGILALNGMRKDEMLKILNEVAMAEQDVEYHDSIYKIEQGGAETLKR